MSAGSCTTEVRTDEAVFEDLAGEWDQLLATAAEANVYLTRSWTGAWWRAFGRGPRLQACRSELHVVTVRRDGALVALAPLLSVRLGAGPLGVRVLMGIGQENADFGGLLVADGDAGALDAVVEHLASELGRGRTVLNLTRLADDSQLLAALRSRLGTGWRFHQQEHEAYPFLDLRALEEPERQVRKLLKKNDVPRRTRRLGEEGEVGWVYDAPDPERGLAAFLRLHDLRWEGRAPNGPFTSIPGRAFLLDASRGLHAEGRLRLSFVTLDGRPIVGRFGTVFGGFYQGMKSGWDPTYATYGLGHMVVGRLIEQALADGLDGFDFMRGAGDHKAAWTNQSRDVGYWTVGRDDRFAAVDHRIFWTAMRLRYRNRGLPHAPSTGGDPAEL